MPDFVVIEREGPVATLTLNDPDRRNALSTTEQWRELIDAIDGLNHDRDLRCAILTGAGSAFCAGGNVCHVRDRTGILAGDDYRISEAYRAGIQQILLAMQRLDVPVIDARTARMIGLVTRVVPEAQLMGESRELAERIARNPGTVLRMTKRLMREAMRLRLDTLLELSASMQALAHRTLEHAAAVAAMVDKLDARKA